MSRTGETVTFDLLFFSHFFYSDLKRLTYHVLLKPPHTPDPDYFRTGSPESLDPCPTTSTSPVTGSGRRASTASRGVTSPGPSVSVELPPPPYRRRTGSGRPTRRGDGVTTGRRRPGDRRSLCTDPSSGGCPVGPRGTMGGHATHRPTDGPTSGGTLSGPSPAGPPRVSTSRTAGRRRRPS